MHQVIKYALDTTSLGLKVVQNEDNYELWAIKYLSDSDCGSDQI